MSEFFQFILYGLRSVVNLLFSMDLGLGFSLGDLDVALLVIGLIATALIVKTGSFASHFFLGNNGK